MFSTSMASTPSASALSAVLRCRGNILTRNPPTKRPATAAYGLGLAGASPAERGRSSKASAREPFLHADRVRSLGTTPRAARASPRARGKTFRETDPRAIIDQPRHAHSDARAVQNALVRQLERRLKTSELPGTHACSRITQKIVHATHVGKILFVRGTGGFPVGVLKASVASPRFLDDTGRISWFVFTGWSALRSTCSSLTALVLLKLTVLWRSSSRSRSAGIPAVQASGQSPQSPGDVISAEEQDRPD